MYLKLIALLIILLFLLNYKSRNEKFEEILNIYNEPLKKCAENNMSNGSWDSEGKCSEKDGGVHQICIKNIANTAQGFSEKTGQSNWSNNRGDNNHCVCLGAWSLYNAKDKEVRDKKILKCNAIPKIALSKNYVSKFSEGWNKWNGLELNNQIKDGVESLVKNCYNKNTSSGEQLRKNYCYFSKGVKVLKDSVLFSELC